MKEMEDILMTSSKLSLEKKTILNLFFTANIMRDHVAFALKPFDISMEQFNVLRILRGKKGEATNLQDIQNRMISKMSNTTRLVDKLISKGFVKRNVCKKNRRKVEIFITEPGLHLLQTIDPIIEESESQITAPLSSQELETLNNLLTKLRT